MASESDSNQRPLLASRQLLAGALAVGFADPRGPLGSQPLDDTSEPILRRAWQVIRQAAPRITGQEHGLGELPIDDADIAPLASWLRLPADERERAHQRVFGLVISRQCPPFETEYSHWKDATYRAQQLADVAGFYTAFGLEPDRTSPQRCDHVCLELQFVSFLLYKLQHALAEPAGARDAHVALVRGALSAFVESHVAWWMPTFGKCLENRLAELSRREIAPSEREHLQALAGCAVLLRAWVGLERVCNGVEPARQVVAPSVELEQPDMSCAGCGLAGGPAATVELSVSV